MSLTTTDALSALQVDQLNSTITMKPNSTTGEKFGTVFAEAVADIAQNNTDIDTLQAEVVVLQAAAISVRAPVIAATTTTLPACTYANGTAGVGATLTGDANGALSAQDGITLTAGQRLLVKDQAAPAQNGVYTVTVVGTGSVPFILTRATDFDTSAEITDGAYFFVGQGSTLADSAWVMTTNGAVTVGTTGIVFVQFSALGQITAGGGLTKTGSTLAVGANADGSIVVNADDIQVGPIPSLRTIAATTLTIASGAVTATQSHHMIDTEGAAASDNLDTINGLTDGQLILIGAASGARTVVVTSGVGNIFCPYNATISLAETTDYVLLMRSGANVFVVGMNIAAIGGGGLGLSLASSAPGFGASLSAYIDSTHNKIPVAATTVQTAVQGLNDAMPVDVFTPLAAAADRVTNTAVGTAFATVLTTAANYFAVGTEATVEFDVFVVGGTGAHTLELALQLDGNAVVTTAAFDVTDAGGDFIRLSCSLRCSAVGVTGVVSFAASSNRTLQAGTNALVTTSGFNAAFDTTATHTFRVLATWSNADVGDIVDLRQAFLTKRLAAAVT